MKRHWSRFTGAQSTHPASRGRAIVLALFVTFLWSTSWVLIKIGLHELPALVFAGLRYCLAFLCLLPLALISWRRNRPEKLSPGLTWQLIALGILFYAITQGAQFVALSMLPSNMVSLILSFTIVIVTAVGMVSLSERPTSLQWTGIVLCVIGSIVYFHPLAQSSLRVPGLIAAGAGTLANAASSIIGRRVNRARELSPLLVTTISMGVGSITLLVVGIAIQGLPAISPKSWMMVAWLAVVNTALAFTLWNRTLQTLSAMESSIINNTMLIQIAFLAWVFLSEGLGSNQILGICLVTIGTLAVQVRGLRLARRNPPANTLDNR